MDLIIFLAVLLAIGLIVGEGSMHYVIAHWRGQQGLLWSFFVNGVAVYAGLIAGALGLGAIVDNSRQWLIAVVLLAIFVWFVWAFVGTIRAGIASFRDPAAVWARRLVAFAVFVCLAAAVYAISSDLPIVWRWLSSLRALASGTR